MTNTNNLIPDKACGTNQSVAILIDVNCVAELLSCSSRHVYRLSESGAMPKPLKLGALIRWRRTELQAWIANGCPTVCADPKGGDA